MKRTLDFLEMLAVVLAVPFIVMIVGPLAFAALLGWILGA